MNEKIRSFTDLEAWREGHRLVLEIYSVSKNFPNYELFGLTSQMRRCAVSITSNVAEGFPRRNHREKVQFYSISLGSIAELQNQLVISRDLGYLKESKFNEIASKTIKVKKLIAGLTKSSKKLNL